jgi:hypothetical protein
MGPRCPTPWIAVAAVALAALCVRLPFIGVGLVPDEGGYAHAASAWADGGRLYHDPWVDRPQGLLLTYRLLLGLHDGAVAIRLGAVVAGAAVAVLMVAVGWLAHSREVGLCAAGLYAVAGVAPRLEGYTLHGELAAAVPATAAIAAALYWRRCGRGWLLVLAGALGGAGVLMKQSSFDGLVVVLVIAVSGHHGLRRGLGPGALVMAGAAAPFAASALHGAAVDFREYWDALIGYRLGAGPSLSERVAELGGSLDLAARDLAPLGIVAALGAAGCVRDRGGGRLALVWLAAAFAGFHVGGAYWAHYYLQLIAPLCLLAAIGVMRLSRPPLRILAVAAVVAPVVVLLAQLAIATPQARPRLVPSLAAADRDERVARYLRRRTTADERIYVLASRANVYFLAGRRPATPYLWHPPLKRIRGAMHGLRRALSHRSGPVFVVVYQPAHDIDPSRRLERLLAARYVTDDRAPPGLPPILVRRRCRCGDATRRSRRDSPEAATSPAGSSGVSRYGGSR